MNIYPVYEQIYNPRTERIDTVQVGYEASLGFIHKRGHTPLEAITAILTMRLMQLRASCLQSN